MQSRQLQSTASRLGPSYLYWLLDVFVKSWLWVLRFWSRIPGIFCNRKCRSKARLDGKTAVITGSNSGIGKETALEFVRRGAKVVMACRDLARAERAAEDIRARTRDCAGAGQVAVVRLDLSSLRSVRECARALLDREPSIHLLVNNAGVFSCPRSLTEDGIEMTFAVNHVGHFLFTLLLLPRILRSAPARIINISSVAHISGHIDFDDLNMEKSYSAYHSYARSKLANILFTTELGERLKGTGVTTYVVHPGFVTTDISRYLHDTYTRLGRWLFETFVLFMTPEQGAQTTIHCAVDEAAGKETGLYYSYCKSSTPFFVGRNKMAAAKLWDVSMKLVGLENYDFFKAEDRAETSELNQNESNGKSETTHLRERHLLDALRSSNIA